jgi:hypothetical protein
VRWAYGEILHKSEELTMGENETVDTRGDQRVDLIASDTNHDGKTDVWVSDTDGDGGQPPA